MLKKKQKQKTKSKKKNNCNGEKPMHFRVLINKKKKKQ